MSGEFNKLMYMWSELCDVPLRLVLGSAAPTGTCQV